MGNHRLLRHHLSRLKETRARVREWAPPMPINWFSEDDAPPVVSDPSLPAVIAVRTSILPRLRAEN